mgnify:CR=1 FL=1
MFATEIEAGVLRAHRSGTRWLATGFDGGYHAADAAYNLAVPEGFDREDLAAYVDERRTDAGFATDGPAMLTGVDLRHARRARLDSVEVLATAGVSNPASLPVDPDERSGSADRADDGDGPPRPGTVNLIVGTTRALAEGALATLLATAVEAKTATLRALTGFTGTTSDAVVVGTDTGGDPAAFAGSATAVGRATRVCVRDALRASLRSRYADRPFPVSVADAEYGVVTGGRAEVSRP